MKKPLHSAEFLQSILRYEPETGCLFWLPRAPTMFKGETTDEQALGAAKWNATYAGTKAFTYQNDRGYCVGNILGVQFKAHRVAYKMVFDNDPDEVDHINMNRSDNRICNLRSVNHKTNCAHMKGPNSKAA